MLSRIVPKLFLILLAACFMSSMANAGESAIRPMGLRTDLVEHTDFSWRDGYLTNIPVDQIDAADSSYECVKIASVNPQFSWIVPGEKSDTRQLAYRITVSSSRDKAEKNDGDLWNSGWVTSANSTSVKYAGAPLKSNTDYFWRVGTRTNTDNESQWSFIKVFMTDSKLLDYAIPQYPLTKTDASPVSIISLKNGNLLADFGKDAFGQLSVTLEAGKEDTVFIHLGERVTDNGILRNPTSTVRYYRYPLRLMAGRHTYRIILNPDKRNTGPNAVKMPDYIGVVAPFRYCEIEGFKGNIALQDLVRTSVNYPFNDSAASFSCSNDTLNRVWNLCKYSLKATSFTGFYIDGDRERIPYEADALINQLCHYAADAEYTMARRSLEYLLKHPTWPTEWILQSVIIAWNDYLFTGDSRALAANYDLLRAHSLVELKDGKTGLITTKRGQTGKLLASINRTQPLTDIVDWPQTDPKKPEKGGEDDGFVYTDYNAVVNAFYYKALTDLYHIALALGKERDAKFYNVELTSLGKHFNKAFFNKDLGCYDDGIGTNHSALHSNMFALALGLANQSQMSTVSRFIVSRGMACSVYGAQYLLKSLYDSGQSDYALQLMTSNSKRSWVNMLRCGSTITLEAWDDSFKPNQDWNHIWGAAPGNIIPFNLMGVYPAVPGCGVVDIKPMPASLSHAELSLPTIRGTVVVDFDRKADAYAVCVVTPANMSSRVFLPVLDMRKHVVKCDGVPLKISWKSDRKSIFVGEFGSGKHLFTW